MPQIAALIVLALIIDGIMAGALDSATVAFGGACALLLALTRA